MPTFRVSIRRRETTWRDVEVIADTPAKAEAIALAEPDNEDEYAWTDPETVYEVTEIEQVEDLDPLDHGSLTDAERNRGGTI